MRDLVLSTTQIHPFAIVSPEARLGTNVRVDAFAVIEAGATVGDNCILRERAHVCTGTTLGKGCVIHMNAVVGHEPQDMSYKGAPLTTIVGDNVVLRENVTIHGSVRASGTMLGDGCYLMAGSHVAHDCTVGRNVILANGAMLAGHVEIGESTFIGGNAGIHQNTKVGRLCMIAGHACVGMDCPPYLIGDGINAITVLNFVGLRRSPLLNEADRREIKDAYKILYRRGLVLEDALKRLESEFTSDAIKHWVAFFRTNGKRGFCRYLQGGRRVGESE